MGIVTSIIVQTYSISNKILALYVEVVHSIVFSRTPVLDESVRNKVMVNNLIPEEVQTGFTNGSVVD